MKILTGIFPALLGGLTLSLLYVVYSDPGTIEDAFSWGMAHPFVPAAVILCGLSIRALIGGKDIRKSVLLQAASVACAFHGILWNYGREVLWNLSLLIRR